MYPSLHSESQNMLTKKMLCVNILYNIEMIEIKF